MPGYRLTKDAQADLIKARRHTIQKWGKAQWAVYGAQLRQAMQMLGNNPEIGISCEDIGRDTYRFSLKYHVLYYRKSIDKVVIAAILHTSMSPDKHLSNRNGSQLA